MDRAGRNQRKPYIVPTSFGLVFGAVVFIILIFALGYANNVIYIFVFLLVSMSITSMWLTNRNLEFVRFKAVSAVDVFACQENSVRVAVENSSQRPAFGFSVFTNDSAFPVPSEDAQVIREIPALSESLVELSWQPSARGWHALPRLQIESTFPFDLLRTWRTFRPTEKVLIYPERKGSSTFPINMRASQNADQQGLFRDLREYSSGDPVKRIDWRASTKHQELLIKVFENEESPSFVFTWENTKHLGSFEDRISQLALWIDLCEKHGNSYSLQVGSHALPLTKGLLHYRECMKVLAELSQSEVL